MDSNAVRSSQAIWITRSTSLGVNSWLAMLTGLSQVRVISCVGRYSVGYSTSLRPNAVPISSAMKSFDRIERKTFAAGLLSCSWESLEALNTRRLRA